MDSSHIIKIFDEYLKTKETSHALLLNGSWGSGKTYFWKNVLEGVCDNNNITPIYLSLNGINKIETLDYRLKIKLIPFLNRFDSKKSASFATLAKNILNKYVQNKYDIDPEQILKDVEIDIAHYLSHLICFDDLERCSIALSEVLGYVNDFVEHKNVKFLLLSDETKISNTQDELTYHSIKEKVIGRTLNFNNSLSETFPLFISKYLEVNAEFYGFLKNHEKLITNLLEEYQEKNLRNLSFFLDVLVHLYPQIKLNIDYSEEVILFSLIITVEFKKGILNSNDVKDYQDLDELNEAYVLYNLQSGVKSILNKKEELVEKSYLEEFYEKYLINHIDSYTFYPSIYVYILSGYFDESQFERELDRRAPYIPTDEEAVSQKVATDKFRDLSDEEFKTAVEQLLDFSRKGKYNLLYYLRISNFLNYFIDNNLLSYTKNEIREALLEGLEIAKNNFELNDRDYSSFKHFNNASEDPILRAKIIEIVDTFKANAEKEKTHVLIEAIQKNDVKKMTEVFEEYKVRKELFESFNAEPFWQILAAAENKTLKNFIDLLDSRHNFSNIKDIFQKDLEFFDNLKSLASAHSNGKSLHDLLVKELITHLEAICERLK